VPKDIASPIIWRLFSKQQYELEQTIRKILIIKKRINGRKGIIKYLIRPKKVSETHKFFLALTLCAQNQGIKVYCF
jgi:hypothetical protein